MSDQNYWDKKEVSIIEHYEHLYKVGKITYSQFIKWTEPKDRSVKESEAPWE